MNKFFCDICGCEIKMNEYGGSYDRIRPNVEHFKDPKLNPQVIKEHSDICEKCCAAFDEMIEKGKLETAEKAGK